MAAQDSSEVWLPVVGYEPFYDVSNFGRVKSKDRVTGSNRQSPYLRPGRILSATPTVAGYPSLRLCAGGKIKPFLVHRLVARAFLGEPNGLSVNHKDGNPANNHISNLEYVTSKQNSQHALNVLGRLRKGEQHPHAKLNDSWVYLARFLYAGGARCAHIADAIGVSRKTIERACTRTSWKHLG